MLQLRHAIIAAAFFVAGIAAAEDRGGILSEYWLGIPGNALSGLTSDTRYPASPSGVSVLTSFQTPVNTADSYGTRVRGFLYPPVTGAYRFWVAGDDQCELWLSTNDSAATKVLIANTYSWTNPQEWTRYASQQSVEITLQAGSRYYIEALHKEGSGGDSLAVAWVYPGVERQVIPGEFLAPAVPAPVPGSGTGYVLREWWSGITGTAVVNLTSAPAFPTSPTGRDYLTTFETPANWGDNYGTRVRGFLRPTQSGTYYFWVSGDDGCQLWLSPDAQPLQKGLIASVPGYTATREWTKYPQQKSVAIDLQAGASYYIEALHKEGGGGDILSVAWAGPGIGDTPTVITGNFLSPSATENQPVPVGQGSGSILVETWNDIPGNNLSALNAHPYFPVRPSARGVLTQFKAPVDTAEAYGRRIRGYVCPTITGNYRFWIASDDEGSLRLSTDENPANAVVVASAPTWTGVEQWDKLPQQQSSLIPLTGGQRYYIEALQKEGNGGDHLAVAWVGPSLIKGVIPGAYLAPVIAPIIDGTLEFTTSTTVTISATGPGGSLRYTTDGTTPTAASTLYAAPFAVTASTVVKAVHVDGNGIAGEVAEQVFVRKGTGTGLAGSYFANEYLGGQPVYRLDPMLQFVWGTTAPLSGIPADHFSARWQGEIETQLNEEYTLILRSDDGVRVWLNGSLVINDWTYHGATDRTCVLPSGRHTLAIEYMEGAAQAELQMFWQSAHQTRKIVPSSQLYPLEGVQGIIPPTSPVSPAYVEVVHGSGASISATVSDNAFPTKHLDDTIRYFNVPLDPAQPTAVAVSSGAGASLTGDITWAPTNVVGNTETVIRKGDSLLLQFPQAGSLSITNYSGTYLGPITVTAGQRLPVLFSKAGEFTIRLNSQGVEVATLDVTVVTADLTHTILSEVGFTRSIDVSINPFDAPLTFIGNSQLLVTTEVIAQDMASLHITPLRRGTPRLQARIHGALGPLVAEQAIDEFTIDNAALHSAAVNAQTGIGTVTLVMRPYIPEQIFTMTMFAHTATFKGGATSLTINSTGGPSSNGEPPMIQKFDTATNETIGIFRFDLEIPEHESKYCFRVSRNQHEHEVEGGAYLPNSGSIFGLQAGLPPSALSLMLGSHTGSGNGPTTNVNGDVCHVLAYASVVFTRAVDSSEDEVGPSSNPEQWSARQWSLVTADYCEKGKKGDGNCNAVSYKLKVSDPPSFGGPLDNQLAALFGGSNKESDCKTCSGECGPITPSMDTGTIPGQYTTSVEVCGTGSNDTLGDAVGGVFYISKLDAHGVGSTTTQFPEKTTVLGGRKGRVGDPVIQMNTGGDGSVNGCSLYGWSGEPYCIPKNKWSFTAVAKDPATEENIPEGYEIRWRLSNFNYDEQGSSVPIPGMEVTATKNGQPLSIEATLPVGRWFPRLEVWRTHGPSEDGQSQVPLEEPELVGIAEIHSIVVEPFPAANVSAKNADATIPDKVRYGARFNTTNNAGGQTVDAKVEIAGSARGRISLDGYPQNQYWVTASDSADLSQVLALADGAAETLYLQGYRTSSTSARSLDVVLSGQELKESCAECSPFLLTPVAATWQETDREKFSSAFDFDIYPSEKKNIYADDHQIHIVGFLYANNYANDASFYISSGEEGTAEFAIEQGSGSLSASEAEAENGLAVVLLQTSTTPGDTYKVKGKEKYAPESISPWRSTAELVVIPGLPATIAVTKSKAQYVSDGHDTLDLTATVKDQFGNLVSNGTEIAWISHDSTTDFESTESETVDGVAKATINAPVLPKNQAIEIIAGEAVVTETITVNRVSGTLTANKASLDMAVNETAVLTLQTDASDGTPVKWFSSNGAITGQGTVSGGTATATLSSSGGLLGRTISHVVVGDRLAVWNGTFTSTAGLAIGMERPTLVGGVTEDGIVNVTWADGSVHAVQYFAKTKVFVQGPASGLAHVTIDGAGIAEAFVFESESVGITTGDIGGRQMSLNGATIDPAQHYTGQHAVHLTAANQPALVDESGINLQANFSIALWVRPESVGASSLVGRPGAWSVDTTGGGVPRFTVQTVQGPQVLTSTQPLTVNSWNKVTISIVGSVASLHVGNASQAMFLVAPVSVGSGLILGGGFSGHVDDLSLSNTTGSPNAIVEGVDAGGRIQLDGTGRAEFLVRSTGTAVTPGQKVFANIHVSVNPSDDEPVVIVETSWWYYPVDFLAGVVGMDTETSWGMVGGVGGGFILVADVGALGKNLWRSTGWSDKEPNGVEALLSGLGLLSTLGGPADGFVSAARVIVARIGDSPLGRIFYRRCKALFDEGAALNAGEEALVNSIKASDSLPQVYKEVIDSDELWTAAARAGDKLGQEAFNNGLQRIATTVGKQTAANVTKVLSELDDAILEGLKNSGKLDDALDGMAKVLKSGGKVEDMTRVLKNEHVYTAAYKQADLLTDFKVVGDVPGIDRTLQALKQSQSQVLGNRYEVECAAFFARQGKNVQFMSKIIDEIGVDGARKIITDLDVVVDGIVYQCKKSTDALAYGKEGLEGAQKWVAAALKEVGNDASKVKYLVPPDTHIPPQVKKFLARIGVDILDIIPHK